MQQDRSYIVQVFIYLREIIVQVNNSLGFRVKFYSIVFSVIAFGNIISDNNHVIVFFRPFFASGSIIENFNNISIFS